MPGHIIQPHFQQLRATVELFLKRCIAIMAGMDKAKFVLTFLAATGIILGGYFFANKVPAIKEAMNGSAIGDKLGLDNPLRAGSAGGELFRDDGAAYVPVSAQGNITRMVAQSMFLKMRQMDQSGTNPFGGLDASDPEARAVIEETIRSVPSTIFKVAIDTSELKTTADNSRSVKLRYVESVSQITKTYFWEPGADRFALSSAQALVDNVQADCFGDAPSAKNAELSKAYGEIFESYKGILVPSSWVAMHKLILGYFKELSEIYGAFTTCKEDPIRAYVGIDRLPEVYAKAPTIQKMLNEKSVELGL